VQAEPVQATTVPVQLPEQRLPWQRLLEQDEPEHRLLWLKNPWQRLPEQAEPEQELPVQL